MSIAAVSAEYYEKQMLSIFWVFGFLYEQQIAECGLLPSNNDNGHTFLMSKELWNEVKEKLAQEGYTKIPYKMKHCFMDQYNDGTGDYNMAGFMIGGTAVYLRKDDEQDNFTLFLPNNE